MINLFLNFQILVEKNQISSLSKLLNEISNLLKPKILNEISSLPKLLNEISGLLKFLNVLVRTLIWDYPPNQQDEVRQAYIKFGPYQSIPPSEAPTSPHYINKNGHQFLPSWYKLFLEWLEFSPMDKAYDKSKKEKMTIVLRFVDKEGFICEQIFDVVHVKNTTSLALEKETCKVLLCHCLNVDDIHGQGYDGASDAQWRSHLAYLNSLMRMFNYVCVVLQDIIKFNNLTQMSEADGIYDTITSVEFVFILDFMIEMLGITNDLCQALQYKLQDILNTMQLVS
ncbi:hypothetical protein PVK06_024092 [Gossypium arboreum]|uniref:DUF4371 domain-containing protein n=1 Tax=Gossypium arboreum TaxID=29729 RepID=A0ABR0PD35_GOSAR|nr:hypothetical protein PVK06_024092 [Gossypium arboreum]